MEDQDSKICATCGHTVWQCKCDHPIASSECDHEWRVLKHTWQTVNYARYQILNHSAETLVCTKCRTVVDPQGVSAATNQVAQKEHTPKSIGVLRRIFG